MRDIKNDDSLLSILKHIPEMTGDIPELPELKDQIRLTHPEGFDLRDYQRKGVARGLELKRFINGDEQGLGKTLQTITTLYAASLRGEDVFPALVICPASMKQTWQREWHTWTPIKSIILNNKIKKNYPRYYEAGLCDVFITNYESMKKYFVESMPPKEQIRNSMCIKMKPEIQGFKSVVFDESHRCKNTDTTQTKLALRIAMNKEWVVLLTGTPVVNRPKDLFPQLAIMGHLNTFGGRNGFMTRYCAGGGDGTNLKELNFKLNQHGFFRREKKDVAKDLPDKQRQTVLCDIETREAYNKAENEFVKYLEDEGWNDEEIARKLRGKVMVQMGELKRISARGKLNEVKEFVHQVVDSGEKLIVFCVLHEIVDALLKEFPKARTITGRDNGKQKQASVDAFQNDPNCKLVICNIKAAGVGLTLTASSRVAFVEYPWHYADCVQCEDRAHRIGQKNNVMCTYFLGQQTIDEKLFQLIQSKAEVANEITGATDKMETDYITSIRNLYLKKAS